MIHRGSDLEGRLGLIEIGSNSLKLTLVRYHGSRYEKVLYRSVVLGLIKEVRDGKLSENALKELKEKLSHFASELISGGADRTIVVLTEFFRKLKDTEGKKLLKSIEDLLSSSGLKKISLKPLSELDEARYSFLALLDHADDISGIVDIGGGSTEVTLSYLSNFASLKIGTWRAKEILERGGEEKLEALLRDELSYSHLTFSFKLLDQPPVFMGGDPLQIAYLLKREIFKEELEFKDLFKEALSEFTDRDLKALERELATLSDEKLSEKLSDPKRLPTIRSTLKLMRLFLRILEKDKFYISSRFISDGIIREELVTDSLELSTILLSSLCTYNNFQRVDHLLPKILQFLVRGENYILILFDPIKRVLTLDGVPSELNLSSDDVQLLASLPFKFTITEQLRDLFQGRLRLRELGVDLSQCRFGIKLDIGKRFLGLLLLKELPKYPTGCTFLFKQIAATYLLITDLYKFSMIDPLTNAYNRRFLFDKLIDEVKRSFRYKYPLTVALMDIDNFKYINDTYGHVLGDQVLREVANYVINNTRKGIDVFARYGGDEFLIILPHTNPQGGVLCCKRLMRGIKELKIDDLDVSISTSWGISWIHPKEDLDPKNLPDYNLVARELIEKADKAMYIAKRDPLNKVVVYSDSTNLSNLPVNKLQT